MKKIISILLLAVFVISLASCGEEDREYDENTVREAALSLIENSKEVNLVFFGTGIRYDTENISFINGAYYPADVLHLSSLGFTTLDELKSKTKAVYTDTVCDIIFETKLSSLEDEGYVLDLARYYENEDGHIMVYTEAQPAYENEIEYLYDTLKVIGSKGQLIYVEIDMLLTNADRKEQRITAELALLEESDGFRLDTYSFAKFNENKS